MRCADGGMSRVSQAVGLWWISCLKLTAPPKFSKQKVKSLRPEAFDYYSTGKARGFPSGSTATYLNNASVAL